MKRCISIFFLAAILSSCYSQDFTINKVEYKNQKVLLHFSIIDTVATRTYTISLFSSRDNFTVPLQKVSGDIGLEVPPGGKKIVSWDVAAEYGNAFSGKIGLEIRGRVYIPFVRLENIKRDDVIIKRGKPYQITWTGGSPQNILNFELYRGDKRQFVFPNIANVGHHAFVFPTSIKPGKNYHFKITDSKNKDEIVLTRSFSVRRKVPLLLKAVPILVIGSVVGYLMLPGESRIIPDPFKP
jgi:hypothetical protein